MELTTLPHKADGPGQVSSLSGIPPEAQIVYGAYFYFSFSNTHFKISKFLYVPHEYLLLMAIRYSRGLMEGSRTFLYNQIYGRVQLYGEGG